MAALHRSLRLIRSFARDRRAMGAVEFAMVTPFLLTLYLGGSQLSMALTINRKVQQAASTINDLVTQSEELKASQIQGLVNVASSIMIPYDLAPLSIKITQVSIDAKGLQKIDWEYPPNKGAKGKTFTLPSDFASLRDRFVVVAETRYTYTPVAGYFITGTIPMGGTSYLNPRNGTKVSCSDCS